ncbi:MAG: asparagine synthase (glutamine-hydrolyzing) [Acetobacteraceae bacterium]|jgi:asparagine synthase (glutamine-hydrolysing)|nr:asparagine synthase (glutamine-hydrolyzing) [Acetobacteraceae bacterium]
MCGIAGIALNPGATLPEATIAALSAAIAHRGPDGEGAHVAAGAVLLQRRLAIIDLATGDQPLFEPGGAALVANGEIYNYVELKAGPLAGTSFATGSDCEPPLHLYRREGLSFAKALRGMYAIAIHDRASRRVVLARDPFGIKPLYIADTRLGIAFASEPGALLDAGLVPRGLDTRARDELLELQFTTGSATIFPGIRRVLPGETLSIEDGTIVSRERLAALPDGGPEEVGETEARARLDRALIDSVSVHQRADVPYGLFLSGGIDSACVLAAMRRLAERPVLAFTAGFDVPAAADEREAARAAARAAGARHEEITVGEGDFWAHLPEIAAAMDDPAADYAIVPTWLLARRAREEVKVVLSGEGGDEMFGGYGRYRSAMRPWWMGGRVMRARGMLERLGLRRALSPGWRDGMEGAAAAAASPGRTRLMAAQATDMVDWLPNDLLAKLDRCLMAHGLEGRTPLLDPAIIGAAFRLPDALKVRKGTGKWLLRTWLAQAMPEARPFAKKQGFTVPVGAWIGARADRLAPLLAADEAVAEVVRPDRVAGLLRAASAKHEAFAAWTLLFYALWHRRHVRGMPPVGDVFETLSQR